jgi:probable rRNA maturation factor
MSPLPLPAETPEPARWPETVEVQVDEAYASQVDAADLARAVAAALQAEGQGTAEVTVVITDDTSIQALNRQYRATDSPTDVLSFPAQEAASGFVSAPEAASYLGDIIIAFPFTERQAAEMGRPLQSELRLLAVHGALHLLGYDHAEPEEEAQMWARQDEILAHLGP